MGEVWVADQLAPIKRRVAIKLIKPGMDSRSVLGRFEAERQALAVMDHPNIAKVLDAGTSADGRPYFVMELVKGTPITEFCDARKLTPKQRLELFIPVCQAIQHAHMKGIIHRDIKPSNVLVELHDDRMVPKVIDFGVAKAVGQQLTEKTIYTGFGALVGTPAYMAPEQATFNALDVDTRADVYALGVLLYELLAGSPPIEKERLKLAALDEVLRIVRDEEPPRPSARLSTSQAKASIAATRGSEPAKLSALMKGEIDWIVMKALEKDRTRRYDTANGLAKDVQRYLAGDAVEACPPTLRYRLNKFLSKNRTAVRIAGAFVCLCLGAVTVGAYLAIRATNAERAAIKERNTAEQERKNAFEAQAEAEAERKLTERKLDAAAVDLDLKYCDDEPRRGLLRLAQRLKTLPADATDLRQFVTLNLFAHAQRMARLVAYTEMLNCISPDGRLGFRAWSGGVAELCNPVSGVRLALLEEGAAGWKAFHFSKDGLLGALVLDNEVRVYDLRTYKQRAVLRPGLPAGWKVRLNTTFTRAVIWSEEEKEGKKPSMSANYQLWDVVADRRITDLHRVEWNRYDGIEPDGLFAFSPDGTMLITVGNDRFARVHSTGDGRLLHTLSGHTADARFAAFSPDGRSAATGSNAEVVWWRTIDWQPDGIPCVQVIDYPWTHDEVRPIRLWGQARMLADGVLAVAVQRADDRRDGVDNYLYVRGEPTAYSNRGGGASDGRLVMNFQAVYSLRPFREWESSHGRRYPTDFGGPLIDRRFLILPSDQSSGFGHERLIDFACDRVVGDMYFGLVPCAIPGCRFVALQDISSRRETGPSTFVLPSVDATFDPDVLELWAKVVTRGQLNPISGFFEEHDEPAWERNRQELLRRAKPVGEFPFPGAFVGDRLYWLRKQDIKNNEKLLSRLITEEPTAENYLARAEYWGSPFMKKYELALRDMLIADELRLKAGASMSERDTTTSDAKEILATSYGTRESYELALKWLDTRPPANDLIELRGLAMYRLGRTQEALDLLSKHEQQRFTALAAVVGGPSVVHSNLTRTLTIGLCLHKLGKSTEAAARLEQARAEYSRQLTGVERWGSATPLPTIFYLEAEDTLLGKRKPPVESK